MQKLEEKITKILLYGLLVISIVLSSGCTQPSMETPPRASNEFVVGALLPLTGDLSFSGQAAKMGIEMAIEDINNDLSDKGSEMKVRVVIENDETDPAVAQEKIKKLKEAGVRFVIGPDSSAVLAAVKPYADENGIILISPESTAPSLSIPQDNVFRMLPDDTHQAQAVAELMWGDGVKAVVPIWRGDVWGNDLYEATKSRFESFGGTVLDGIRYDPMTDFFAELNALSSKVNQAVNTYGKEEVAVYFLGFDEAVTLFTKAQNNTSISRIKWYGSDGTALNNNLLDNLKAARFAVETGFSNPYYSIKIKDKYRPLEEKFKTKPVSTHVLALTAYDALWLSTLTYIASNKSADINVLKKTLFQTAGSYDGATGLTILNQAGDRKFASYDFWAINEKDRAYVWERVAKYPFGSLLNQDQDFLIKNEVQTAVSMLQALYEKSEKGQMTQEDVKKIGEDLLRDLRYSDNKEGYFFADTTEGFNVVLYGNKDVEGKNRYYSNIKGIYYVQELIAKGMQPGGGYTDYWYPKKGEFEPRQKRSYSLLFEPFGWIVGTGYYVETKKEVPPILMKLDAEITSTLNKMDSDLALAAQELSKTDLHEPEAKKILRNLCTSNSYVVDCATVDIKGKMLAIEPGKYQNLEGSDISKQEQVILLQKSKRPVFSKIFRSVEGFDAVDLEYPVFSSKDEFIGSVSLLIRPESLFSAIVNLTIAGLPVNVWAMQKDGRIIYDQETEEIGRILFDDPLYKPYPQLLSLGRRIARERTGSGTYEFPESGTKGPVKKMAYWTTVGLHGTEWRLVVT